MFPIKDTSTASPQIFTPGLASSSGSNLGGSMGVGAEGGQGGEFRNSILKVQTHLYSHGTRAYNRNSISFRVATTLLMPKAANNSPKINKPTHKSILQASSAPMSSSLVRPTSSPLRRISWTWSSEQVPSRRHSFPPDSQSHQQDFSFNARGGNSDFVVNQNHNDAQLDRGSPAPGMKLKRNRDPTKLGANGEKLIGESNVDTQGLHKSPKAVDYGKGLATPLNERRKSDPTGS